MRLRRAAVGALLVGAVLVPTTAAAARHHPAPKLRLSLVPLQTAQLGSAGTGLALDYGSGPRAKRNLGLKFEDFRSFIPDAYFKSDLGGVARYALDYGDPFIGSTGVMELRSGVEEYKTPAAAKKSFAFSLHLGVVLSRNQPGTLEKLKAPPVGQRSAAYLIDWAAPDLNPIVKLDEQVLAGRFVLALTVTAGSTSAAEKVAPHLLRVLHRRLQLLLAGHLTGKPAKLPPRPHAGQAPGGPDLSTMVLQPSDVDPDAGYDVQRYVPDLPALSAYLVSMNSAGLYDAGFEQVVFWWPTATEATYTAAYFGAEIAKAYGAGSAVDLSAVGDNATGTIVAGTTEGSVVGVTLTNGQAGSLILGLGSGAAPTDSDVQSLAQAAANRLDAGLGP
jgi:hypothetical protein